MENDIGGEVKTRLLARVANWEVAVDLEVEVEQSDDGISVHVYPTGEGARFWAYVSRGVPGHSISPRRTWSTPGHFRGYTWGRGTHRAALRLHSYSAMTRAGNVYGRPKWKQFSGYRYHVWWPGITPRLFEENVAAEMKSSYSASVWDILRGAVQAAMREAR